MTSLDSNWKLIIDYLISAFVVLLKNTGIMENDMIALIGFPVCGGFARGRK